MVTTGLLVPVRAAELDRVPAAHDGTAVHILDWMQSGTLDTSWSIRVDRLTTIMLIVVTTVSALVHLYSMGYMAHDENFRETRAIARASSRICRSSPSRC